MELSIITEKERAADGTLPRFNFHRSLAGAGMTLPPLSVATLQINVGKICNQACLHCHVDAGPKRTETMEARTADKVLDVLAAHPEITTLDITGGAPELNDEFERLVVGARALGKHVMVRHNIT